MSNNETFLAVKKANFGIGLKSIEILIISQIDEYTRNGRDCYVTNKQFSEMFGESESTIARTIEKLEKKQIVKRDTKYVSGNGRGNRQRVLTINDKYKWQVESKTTEDNGDVNMTQPKDDGNVKSEEWKCQNDTIKENLKEKSSKRKGGAKAPEKKIDKEKEKRIQDKLSIRNDNPEVMEATKLFIDYTNKELYDLQKGLANRSITYPKLKDMGLPNNASIYGLVDLEIKWRQRDRYAAPNLIGTVIGS